MGIPFLKVSTIYLLIGICLGIYMGIADAFQFTAAHTHINLLGWGSFAVIGIIYHLFPEIGANVLAKVQFLLMMIGVPLLSFAMILFAFGQFTFGGPLSGIGGLLILVGVILFMINILKNLKAKVRLE